MKNEDMDESRSGILKQLTSKTSSHHRLSRIEATPTDRLKRIALSFMLMSALICVVITTKAPNPNMILIAGLVASAALLGPAGTVTAASLMLAYTLYFFSSPDGLFTYAPEGAAKVTVSMVGIAVVSSFTCALERAHARAFAELMRARDLLKLDIEALEHAASSDALTGVRNRLSLTADIEKLSPSTTLFVMMVDVDDFKQINDRYGHAAGDAALKTLAHWLAALFGTRHAYRFGGDEFCVVIPTTSSDTLKRNIECLENVICDSKGIRISCGYVFGPARDAADVHHMLQEADEQLLLAKQNGKGHAEGAERLPKLS